LKPLKTKAFEALFSDIYPPVPTLPTLTVPVLIALAFRPAYIRTEAAPAKRGKLRAADGALPYGGLAAFGVE
jgi:hypothetical protein